jgi:hypothetical protein
MIDRVFRSLLAVSRENPQAPVRLYVGFKIGPEGVVQPGATKASRYHARDRSLEIDAEFDSDTPDDLVGPTMGRLLLQAIELGRADLGRRKVALDTGAMTARIDKWLNDAEWRALIPTPRALREPGKRIEGPVSGDDLVEVDEWPERLEVHVSYLPAVGAAGASGAMDGFEYSVDRLLDGLGALEGNEIGEDEWVTFIDCADAEAALAVLTPALGAMTGVASIYVLKCSRVVIR